MIPVGGMRNVLDMTEIISIVGGKERNVITEAMEGGFDALNEELAHRVAQGLCPKANSSFIPLQEGDIF